MDQQHCQLPWNGTQSSFGEPSKQKIVGVKEHGYGVHIFPAIDTVRKGANLMIYIIDTEMECIQQLYTYKLTVVLTMKTRKCYSLD